MSVLQHLVSVSQPVAYADLNRAAQQTANQIKRSRPLRSDETVCGEKFTDEAHLHATATKHISQFLMHIAAKKAGCNPAFVYNECGHANRKHAPYLFYLCLCSHANLWQQGEHEIEQVTLEHAYTICRLIKQFCPELQVVMHHEFSKYDAAFYESSQKEKENPASWATLRGWETVAVTISPPPFYCQF